MIPTEHSKQPFFAQFMEAQKRQMTEEELNSSLITGKFLDTDRTTKYPSDGDDDDSIL